MEQMPGVVDREIEAVSISPECLSGGVPQPVDPGAAVPALTDQPRGVTDLLETTCSNSSRCGVPDPTQGIPSSNCGHLESGNRLVTASRIRIGEGSRTGIYRGGPAGVEDRGGQNTRKDLEASLQSSFQMSFPCHVQPVPVGCLDVADFAVTTVIVAIRVWAQTEGV